MFAVGNLVGTILGGQLADRLYDRLLTFALAMAASGFSALALFVWHPGVVVSVALGFVYVFLNALGRPSLMASYAAVPEQARNTVMGLTGTAASVGWAGAAGLGAAMISLGGFDGFGPLGLVLGLLVHGGGSVVPPAEYYLRLIYRAKIPDISSGMFDGGLPPEIDPEERLARLRAGPQPAHRRRHFPRGAGPFRLRAGGMRRTRHGQRGSRPSANWNGSTGWADT